MNFRQVGKKINSVSNVKQITRAMQMVASVKMKKAQEEALEGKLYRDELRKILSRVLPRVKSAQVPFSNANSGRRKLYIFVSSNKGLCGSFNLNLFKLAMDKIDFNEADFITVGKKSSNFLVKMKSTVVADFSLQVPFIDNVSPIFSMVSERFVEGKYDSVHLIYNSFVSTLKHEPTIKKLLPIGDVQDLAGSDVEGSKETTDEHSMTGEYLIEPSPREVLQVLVSDFLEDQLRGAFLDSEAAEHSARMMAMKSATDNAEELIYSLTLVRNKLRQTQITNELLDITTAKLSGEVS